MIQNNPAQFQRINSLKLRLKPINKYGFQRVSIYTILSSI